MKKFCFVLLMLLTSLSVNAQLVGGFYHADPDAWVDKEPFFACRNNFTYNGWGQNIYNVTAVINDTDVYTFPNTWVYGSIIQLGRGDGIEISSGDKVTLYSGNNIIGTWIYQSSSALPDIKLKGTGKFLKGLWKYVKRIR